MHTGDKLLGYILRKMKKLSDGRGTQTIAGYLVLFRLNAYYDNRKKSKVGIRTGGNLHYRAQQNRTCRLIGQNINWTAVFVALYGRIRIITIAIVRMRVGDHNSIYNVHMLIQRNRSIIPAKNSDQQEAKRNFWDIYYFSVLHMAAKIHLILQLSNENL